MKPTGKVYLIPCPLNAGASATLPTYIASTVRRLKYFFVEEERSARRFLKFLDKTIAIDTLQLYLMNEHHPPDTGVVRQILEAGHDLGVMSEAGCPGIADPGSKVVLAAHQIGASVIPLVGPSSILLALMASGLNGQNFQFVGYLPVKPPERIKALKELELQSQKQQQTQLFIEAPYRNNQLLQDILKTCRGTTLLCIAADLTGENEFIQTRSVQEWRTAFPELHKRPAIFLLLAV